ncbi:MAG: hypothetical protein GXP35_13945 [Actinobacteria bacterium]|nr:hypothetical protein [Actinomycetota bacterium]
MHNASMTNVLVRNLPADVHKELERRANAAGQSLQQYLTVELSQLARRPTIEDILESIGRQTGGKVGFEQAVQDLNSERNR